MRESVDQASSDRSLVHLIFLDHIRGVAIFLVYIFHCAASVYPRKEFEFNISTPYSVTITKLLLYFPSLGWAGVALFFVVSGFCIHLSHSKSKEKGFGVFFIRRFFRIYPPYLVALLFFTFILGPDLEGFISHLFLVHNLSSYYALSINSAFWSIGTETQLYVLYPLVLWIAQRAGWTRCLWIVLAVEVLFRFSPQWIFHLRGIIGDRDANVFIRNPLYYWFSWTIGAAIADDWLNGRPIFLSRFPIWLWIVLFLFSTVYLPLSRFSFPLAALCTASVIAAVLSKPLDFRWLTKLPFVDHFRKAGVVSYSVYLLHLIFLMLPGLLLSRFYSGHIGPALMLMVLLLEWPLVLLFGYASYLLLELPSISLGKSLIKTLRLSCDARKLRAN